MRAEIGSLFGALSVMCAALVWTRERFGARAAIAVLASVVVGRLLGWAANGAVGDFAPLAIELCAIAVLALTLRSQQAAVRADRGTTNGTLR